MNGELLKVVEQVGREKGIETEIIISALEEAIVMASKKYFRTNEELISQMDRESGNLIVFARKTVVETVSDPDMEIGLEEALEINPEAELEGTVDIPKSTEGLGRIAAQAAKQVIYQKVREAERDIIYEEYSERIDEVVTGLVKRFEKGDMIIDLGNTEAVCPKKEQSRHETYRQDDRIRAVIVDVSKSAKGPQVIVSRTNPGLIRHLFEMEVPEIYDGTIRIVEAVREPGERAKVAVVSREKDVDPVGACVGMKGVRVQSIIRELRGEKIDIVQYSPDPQTFATNALNPAKVNRVILLDESEKILEVVVDEDQLSLAIGKRGQNVRLGAKLIGWRIDIKSEEEKRREVELEFERAQISKAPLQEVEGISEKDLAKLLEHGFETVGDLHPSVEEDLLQLPGIGPKTAEKMIKEAEDYVQVQLDLYLEEKLAEEEEDYDDFFESDSNAGQETTAEQESTTGQDESPEDIEDPQPEGHSESESSDPEPADPPVVVPGSDAADEPGEEPQAEEEPDERDGAEDDGEKQTNEI